MNFDTFRAREWPHDVHTWGDWSTNHDGSRPTQWWRYCQRLDCSATEIRESVGYPTEPVTLPRLVYDRLMHLAYAGANHLAEPNGKTDVEPYPVNKAWLDQIDKEAGNG